MFLYYSVPGPFVRDGELRAHDEPGRLVDEDVDGGVIDVGPRCPRLLLAQEQVSRQRDLEAI